MRLAQERSMKQSSRFRLVADKGISVASIQSILSEYMRYKESPDLWCLVAPPPTGPQTFGWQTNPSGDWLCKTAALLYDLVGLAPNTKLQSIKLWKCLKSMYLNKELHLDTKKGYSVDDWLDKLDLTIRILLNMIRCLKCNEGQRLKVQKSMTSKDWSRVEHVLERVQLPPELLAASSLCQDEDEDVSSLKTISVHNEHAAASGIASSAAECPAPCGRESAAAGSLALVPASPKLEQKRKMGASHNSLGPLPAVFQKHLEASSGAVTPVSSASAMKKKQMEKILQQANTYEAEASTLPLPKLKAKKQEKKSTLAKKKKSQKNKKTKKIAKKDSKPKTDKEPLNKKKTNSQKPKTQKKKIEKNHAENAVYKPGEMLKQREIYVKNVMNNTEMTRQEALKSWQGSLSRAILLKDLSPSELVKRRFVAAGCKSNPFAEIVDKHSKSQDID